MGTFYTLGVVNNFTATAYQAFPQQTWEKILNERLDLEQYTLEFDEDDKRVKGKLKEGLFEENIEDLYALLVEITGKDSISDWFESRQTNMNEYDRWLSTMKIKAEGAQIEIKLGFLMLFIEGKVMAEEFSIEPKLMNWLFRHANLSNKLSGCMMSDVVG